MPDVVPQNPTPQQPESVQDFAARIKSKYPDYQGTDDFDLVNRIIQKYPAYKSSIDPVDYHSQRTGVDPNLIRAVMGQESSGNANAVSPKGAGGLMQLMPGTAARFGVRNRFDPFENVRGGTDYLKWLSDRYNGDIDKTLAAYNAGEGAVDKFGGVPPYQETRNYVPAVKARFQSLQQAEQTPATLAKPSSALSSVRLGTPTESPSNPPAGAQGTALVPSSAGTGAGAKQAPQILLKPRVTSSMSEGAEMASPAEIGEDKARRLPIEFKPDTSEQSSMFAQAAERASSGPSLPSTHPDVVGAPVTATFDKLPDNNNYIVDTLAAKMGLQALRANQAYRAETGRNLIDPQTEISSQATVNAKGQTEVTYRPTQGLIRIINSYNAGGLDAAKGEAAKVKSEKLDFLNDQAKQTSSGVVEGLKKGFSSGQIGDAQFLYNISMLSRALYTSSIYGTDSPEYKALEKEDAANQTALTQAAQSNGQASTTTGQIIQGIVGSAVELPQISALGGNLPMATYVRHLNEGQVNAGTQAMLAIPTQALFHAVGGATSNLPRLQQELIARGAAGTLGAAMTPGGVANRAAAFATGALLPVPMSTAEAKPELRTSETVPPPRPDVQQFRPPNAEMTDKGTQDTVNNGKKLAAAGVNEQNSIIFNRDSTPRIDDTANLIAGETGSKVVKSNVTSGWIRPETYGQPVTEEAVRKKAGMVVNTPDKPYTGGESFNQFSNKLENFFNDSIEEAKGKIAIIPVHAAEVKWLEAGGLTDTFDKNEFLQGDGQPGDIYKKTPDGLIKPVETIGNAKPNDVYFVRHGETDYNVGKQLENNIADKVANNPARQAQEDYGWPQGTNAQPVDNPEAVLRTPAEIPKANIPEAVGGGTRLNASVFGLGEFGQEALQKAKDLFSGVKDTTDGIKSLLAPATRGEEAKATANIVRANAAELARKHDIAEASLNEARKQFSYQSPQANYDFINRMETGQPQADANTTAYANQLRQALDERRQKIQDLGTGKLQNFIENYFPHIWQDPKQAKDKFAEAYSKKPLEGSKSFLKQRSIPTTQEGLNLGLKPVSDNPVDLTMLKLREMDKYLMAHKTMQQMKEQGLLKFVRATEAMPDGYTKIDDRVGTVYGPISPEGAQQIRGYYAAPENAAKILNNYLSPGMNSTWAKVPYQAVRKVSNTLNQAQLGLSAFHAGFTSLDVAVSRFANALEDLAAGRPIKAIKTAASTPLAPLTNLLEGNKMLKEWYAPGSQGQEYGQLVKAAVEGGGRARQDAFYKDQLTKKFGDALKRGNVISAALRLPGATIEQLSKPVMEHLVPRQKMGVFAEMARREIERLGPNATQPQIREAMGKAWDSVDNRMGQMVYDNLFWSNMTKDLAMASVRSVGWNIGTAREVGGGLRDFATLPKRAILRDSQPLFTHKMAYTVAMPVVVGALGGMMTYLMTGKRPEDLKDYYFPRTGGVDEAGNPERISLPSYMKDLYPLISKPSLRTVGTMAKNKVNPLIGLIADTLENRDYYNTEIRNADDPLVQQLLDTAKYAGKQFEPFALRGLMKERERGGSFAKQALPFVGITPAPKYVNDTPATEKMDELIKAKLPQGTRTKEQAEKSYELNDLIRKARRGESIDTSNLEDKDAKRVERESKETALQVRFKRLSLDEAKRVYGLMDDKEKAEVQGIYDKKTQPVLRRPARPQRGRLFQ